MCVCVRICMCVCEWYCQTVSKNIVRGNTGNIRVHVMCILQYKQYHSCHRTKLTYCIMHVHTYRCTHTYLSLPLYPPLTHPPPPAVLLSPSILWLTVRVEAGWKPVSWAIVPRGQWESEIHNARVRVTAVMARPLGSTILHSQWREGGFRDREGEKEGGDTESKRKELKARTLEDLYCWKEHSLSG